MVCVLILSAAMVATLGGAALTRATAELGEPNSVETAEPVREIAMDDSIANDGQEFAEREPGTSDVVTGDIKWSESTINGLRLGSRQLKTANPDVVTCEVWVRNETEEAIHIPRDCREIFRPEVKDVEVDDAEGKHGNAILLGDRRTARFRIVELQTAVTVAPGKQARLPLQGVSPKVIDEDVDATSVDEPSDVAGTLNGLLIQAVSKETGKPLSGVAVKSDIFLESEHQEKELTTGRTGLVILTWDANEKPNRLYFICVKKGYVPVYYFYDNKPSFGELPTDVTLAFEKGRSIGGIVVDENDKPLPRVGVELSTIATIPKRAYYWNNVAELTTDADGRWRWDGAPNDLGLYSIEFDCPGYLDERNTLQHGMETPYRMKRGVRLTGRVLTDRGELIERATVLLGYQHNVSGAPRAQTDSDGRFVFATCEPGETLLTVHASNRAPESRKIVIGEREDAGDFRLGPGHTVRVRVVDDEGRPVDRAMVQVESWKGHKVLSFWNVTDEEGRLEWNGAPADEVLYRIGAKGYATIKRHPLRASENEHVVTLTPELVVRGKVTDATTGKPIPSFVIRPGFGGPSSPSGTHWLWDHGVEYRNGAYEWNPAGRIGSAHRLRVEAPGYHMQGSPEYDLSDGAVTFDFALERGTDVTGVVIGVDGKPLPEARVALAKTKGRVRVEDGHFSQRHNNALVARTNASGEFTFLPQDDGPFLLLAMHDEGFAYVTRKQFAQSSSVNLQSWGRIEGTVRLGENPEANCEMWFTPTWPEAIKPFMEMFFWEVRADGRGHFAMERVIPGPGVVTRILTPPKGAPRKAASAIYHGWERQVDVTPGETSHVLVGGTGREVVGQFELPHEESRDDWRISGAVSVARWDVANDCEDEKRFRCYGWIDQDRRFEIPDVLPGVYRLTKRLRSNAHIANAELTFTVSAGDAPLDLGKIQVDGKRSR
jgi:protocatechuate 3,4-dioxygenase beta subunit